MLLNYLIDLFLKKIYFLNVESYIDYIFQIKCMVIVKTKVTISSTIILTLLIIGFQSSVFAQSTNSFGSPILGNSQIGDAEMKLTRN